MTLDELGSALSKLIATLVVVGLVLASLWYWSPPAVDATRVEECRQKYAKATTHSDTTRIDGLIPEMSGKETTAMTCGALRRSYPKYFK